MKFISVDGNWFEYDATVISITKIEGWRDGKQILMFQPTLWVKEYNQLIRGPICKNLKEAAKCIQQKDFKITEIA